MKKLSKAGIKGFILDLRFNPGGLLDSAVKISDLFIDDGLIVSIRPRNAPENLLRRQGGRQLRRLPDGLPRSTAQRQRQRNRLGLPAGSRPGRHRRLAQLRQRQRADDASVQRNADLLSRQDDTRHPQADHRHVLAAQRQEPEQGQHQGRSRRTNGA